MNKIKLKKSLGQNFLRDEKILKKIADFALIERGDTVVEVGPGEGTLTKLLLERAGKVIAVEKDETLAEFLKEKFREQILDNRLKIIDSDILEYNLPSINYKLVGNIPYNITGAIFKKFLESSAQPSSITFVIQKEVADRIIAKDKRPTRSNDHSGKESILSISIKAYGKPEYGGMIKKGSFYPRPKVDSAIISVRDINKDNFQKSGIGEEKFFKILKQGFSHKRKLLTNNLKIREAELSELGLNPKSRAEDLSVNNWFDLGGSIVL